MGSKLSLQNKQVLRFVKLMGSKWLTEIESESEVLIYLEDYTVKLTWLNSTWKVEVTDFQFSLETTQLSRSFWEIFSHQLKGFFAEVVLELLKASTRWTTGSEYYVDHVIESEGVYLQLIQVNSCFPPYLYLGKAEDLLGKAVMLTPKHLLHLLIKGNLQDPDYDQIHGVLF